MLFKLIPEIAGRVFVVKPISFVADERSDLFSQIIALPKRRASRGPYPYGSDKSKEKDRCQNRIE